MGVTYRFVDTVSRGPSSPARPLPGEDALVSALDISALESAVRHLASREMAGRARGTPGGRIAREYLAGRLQRAGLSPLFAGAFEQPTFPNNDAEAPYAINVGGYWPAADPGAGWIALVAHYDHLGVRRGKVYAGADDNASAVAVVLTLADALGRARPSLRRHVALVFPDAEEPPNIRTDRMGSTWFWQHPPFPLASLHCALVFDLLGWSASPEMRAAGLENTIFVLGAEAGAGLAELGRSVSEAGVEPMPLGLPMIEAYPVVTWRRFARGDYHGLREHGGRPFLFLTAGRAPTYHTPDDTPETLDYIKLGRVARWTARLTLRAAQGVDELAWTDGVADPVADARGLLRLYAAAGDGRRFPWLLRRALVSDRGRAEALLAAWKTGAVPTAAEYRELTLFSLRLQAALWHPRGWWFALW
jgi:hypothetical protein